LLEVLLKVYTKVQNVKIVITGNQNCISFTFYDAILTDLLLLCKIKLYERAAGGNQA